MRAPLFLISLLLSSAACSQADEYREEVGVTSQASASAVAESSSAQETSFEDNSEAGGGKREFSYEWPAAVSAIAGLTQQLTAERDKALAEQKAEWTASLKDAPADCVSCRIRDYDKEWEVVADLPQWLSLSAEFSTYTGGAHGMHGKQSLVWDKQAGRSMDGVALFTSPVALETALGTNLCNALNAERTKRRGAPVGEAINDIFSDCPGIDEATIMVGSASGEHFDRLTVYFGPYVAGPYAEGDYELDFPVTASVIDAVKPQYAAAFRVGR